LAQKKGELLLVAERQQRRQAQMPVGTQAQLWVSKKYTQIRLVQQANMVQASVIN
jgi:hypothetical protein